ncbi:MAG: DNA double-strand break repair nuclease NurA [Anaerolineales bacterium]|nr:DNA double-strand break repair nuclease NurA [Anaerolineales bacterium]
MSLEFERLTTVLEEMSQSELKRLQRQDGDLTQAEAKLAQYATNWGAIAACVMLVEAKKPTLRLARPLDERDPLDAAIPVPPCPPQATLIAVDGSQILPDRHAAFLYYLLNVGGIVYYHGNGEPPTEFSRPMLHFREDDLFANGQLVDGTIVGARRDLAEVEMLADMAWECRHESHPLLAIMDQRLLYWPASAVPNQERNDIVAGWLKAMTKVRDSGGLMAGYIDRSRRGAVLALLSLLQPQQTDFHAMLEHQEQWGNLTDADLFDRLLAPGERSRVFVDLSNDNDHYRQHDAANEICFFYLNAARVDARISAKSIVRVDIPRWVADDEEAVAAVHALLYDQCQILGHYPYVITRADEKVVVGRQDQEEFNNWIALKMQELGIEAEVSAKQGGKGFGRAGKTRHELR